MLNKNTAIFIAQYSKSETFRAFAQLVDISGSTPSLLGEENVLSNTNLLRFDYGLKSIAILDEERFAFAFGKKDTTNSVAAVQIAKISGTAITFGKTAHTLSSVEGTHVTISKIYDDRLFTVWQEGNFVYGSTQTITDTSITGRVKIKLGELEIMYAVHVPLNYGIGVKAIIAGRYSTSPYGLVLKLVYLNGITPSVIDEMVYSDGIGDLNFIYPNIVDKRNVDLYFQNILTSRTLQVSVFVDDNDKLQVTGVKDLGEAYKCVNVLDYGNKKVKIGVNMVRANHYYVTLLEELQVYNGQALESGSDGENVKCLDFRNLYEGGH